MKKLFTAVFALLLAGSLGFAQATGGSPGKQDQLNPQPLPPGKIKGKDTKTAESKTHKGGKKGHKGGKTVTDPDHVGKPDTKVTSDPGTKGQTQK